MKDIKLTYCEKTAGFRNGNGPRWNLEFTCQVAYNAAHQELTKLWMESFTSGEMLFIIDASLVQWYNPTVGCRFSARAYNDNDVMLLKLVYG